MIARGIRNNNPLNIRADKRNKWEGMRAKQTDKAFVQFTERKYGYRAAFIILRGYIKQKGANTVGRIIGRWAPSADGNNTQAYVAFVSHVMGVKPDETVSFEDTERMVTLVASMAMMESGIVEDKSVIEEAYKMI